VKVRLQPGKCAGHAQCHAANPDLFPIDDEGYSALDPLRAREIALADQESARLGVSTCPELALTVEED
jgi:ferredoxin